MPASHHWSGLSVLRRAAAVCAAKWHLCTQQGTTASQAYLLQTRVRICRNRPEPGSCGTSLSLFLSISPSLIRMGAQGLRDYCSCTFLSHGPALGSSFGAQK